jgi:SAM-dependent methyltransferase
MTSSAAAPAELPFSPAADRNKAPILQALRRLLPPAVSVLEIASGTGQHAQHVASACPGWTWQPTDAADAAALQAIDQRCRGLTNVLPAVRLNVLEHPWPVELARYSAVYCANMLHIAPWPTCAALMKGAAKRLTHGGPVLIYGPFRVDGVPTASSNEAFDADLRARNPDWGLRLLSAVEREAAALGLVLRDVIDMPANNLLVSFTPRAS